MAVSGPKETLNGTSPPKTAGWNAAKPVVFFPWRGGEPELFRSCEAAASALGVSLNALGAAISKGSYLQRRDGKILGFADLALDDM